VWARKKRERARAAAATATSAAKRSDVERARKDAPSAARETSRSIEMRPTPSITCIGWSLEDRLIPPSRFFTAALRASCSPLTICSRTYNIVKYVRGSESNCEHDSR